MRLQRFLSQAGVASRRKAETMITSGHVRVNGRVVSELGSKIDPSRDRVEVNGKRVVAEEHIYILLNKPRGYVTTLSDPEGRPTVLELVEKVGARVYPVGRLDFNTEGLLVLTNDGDLANGLMHPRGGVEKVYHVKVRGQADARVIDQIRRGLTLDDGERTQPTDAELLGPSEGGNNSWLEVVLREGKNRQIHRMCEALGLTVAKLRRVRYAGIDLGDLRSGRWRPLNRFELQKLKRKAAKGAR
jgi:23S rRNA pseudouridine2605 synthase